MSWSWLLLWWYLGVGFGLVILLELRDLIHSARCDACQHARRFVARCHPDWRVTGSLHRASEEGRDVIAVVYSDPDRLRKPPPYVLVTVSRDGACEEVVPLPDSPYWIRGRK